MIDEVTGKDCSKMQVTAIGRSKLMHLTTDRSGYRTGQLKGLSITTFYK